MKWVAPVCLWFFSVSCLSLTPLPRLNKKYATSAGSWEADAAPALREVLQASSLDDVSLIIITENISKIEVGTLVGASRGVAVFEADKNGSQLVQVVSRARQIRCASWVVVVAVVSYDAAFLAAFARLAREGRLLSWEARLIVVTRPAPRRRHPLHQTLAFTNSLLLLPDGSGRVAVWALLPYTESRLLIASWTVARGLHLYQPLFLDKFKKFSKETNLVVAMEKNHRHSAVMLQDPSAPGGERLHFTGFMVTVLEYLAQGLNFSYTFQRPPDGSWGGKMRDGSYSGMLGQVQREEVHFGLGPFSIDAARYEAVDFTWPVSFVITKVFAGRGSPEVDPWSFLHPLSARVWAALLASLMLLSLAFFLSACILHGGSGGESLTKKHLHLVSIVLRQPVQVNSNKRWWWWWERVVLGVWMLATLVVTRSYESNLMSQLAVRHMAQPYQSLRDVMDDPSVVMVWHKQGALMQAVMDSTSGILSEVKASGERGRLQLLPLYEYVNILDEVMAERKVIIDYDIITTATQSEHFSRTGRCDFYVGQENILSHPLALISQKDNPLIPALNEQITSMTEAGLYSYWNEEGNPNASACEAVPTRITVSSSLSLRQCWAMLVVLAGGLTVGLATLCLEVILAGVLDN